MSKILQVIIYDDYNSKVVSGDIIGTITTRIGIPTLRNGIKIIEIRNFKNNKPNEEIN